MRLARHGAGVALVARPFVTRYHKSGVLVDVCPGKQLAGKTHGISSLQLEMARPEAKKVVRWLLDRSGQIIPDYI